jgi:ABC-type uncharacterized transport system auxiliary subunit
LKKTFKDLQVLAEKFIRYFGLRVDEAERVFKELYPADLNQQQRQDRLAELANSNWGDFDADLVSSQLKTAFAARKQHKELQSHGISF